MIPLTVEQLATATGAEIVSGDPGRLVDSVTIDSRRLRPGACFFAIAGARHDGHDFLSAAAAAGAAALVAHRAAPELPDTGSEPPAVLLVADTTAALQALAGWLRGRLDPAVVAITGSLGKTTTKEMTAALLRPRFDVHATPGNLNNHWGLPLSLLGLETHHDVMVAELAMSHAGEIRMLARIARPGIGVITNVAPAHMEGFADLDAVATAKGELADELAAAATLIVNADDPRTLAIGATAAGRGVGLVSFGRHADAAVRAGDIVRAESGWRFLLHLPEAATVEVSLHIPGAGAIPNFLAAAAVAAHMGVAAPSIAATAATLEPLPNRGALLDLDGVTLLDESYNASPVATATALETISHVAASGRRIAALGDMLEMGDWAEGAHRDAGRRAAQLGIDVLVAVGEHADWIASGGLEAGLPRSAVHVFAAADEAGAWLAGQVRAGDALLVKGSRAVHMERVVEAVGAARASSRALAGD